MSPNTWSLYLTDDGSLYFSYEGVKDAFTLLFSGKSVSGTDAVFNLPSQSTEYANYLTKVFKELR